jgi:hypothetical protein
MDEQQIDWSCGWWLVMRILAQKLGKHFPFGGMAIFKVT